MISAHFKNNKLYLFVDYQRIKNYFLATKYIFKVLFFVNAHIFIFFRWYYKPLKTLIMKSNFTYAIFISFVVFASSMIYSQDFNSGMGDAEFTFNEAKIPCLTFAQREQIKSQLQYNVQV